MNINEVLKIAKSGYSPSEIKKLMDICNESPDKKKDIIELAQNGFKVEDITDLINNLEDEGTSDDNKPDGDEGEEKPEEVDYKKLYDDAILKIEKIQKDNVNKDNGKEPIKTDEEILNEVFSEMI